MLSQSKRSYASNRRWPFLRWGRSRGKQRQLVEKSIWQVLRANSMPVRTSPPRQQGGRKSRRSSGNFSRRYAPAGPAAGIAPQELARPPCSPVCARSGDHCGAPLNDAVSSEGRCVRFLTAKLCERAPSAQIQRTHFLGLAPTGPHRANFPPRITRAATAQAAAADLISGTRDRTRACCAVTAAPTTSKMRGNCRNVATG